MYFIYYYFTFTRKNETNIYGILVPSSSTVQIRNIRLNQVNSSYQAAMSQLKEH